MLSEMIRSGTNKQITLGTNKLLTILKADIWPPIHSMVVVTSPIGDQGPPAFAAITTMPANFNLSSWFGTNLRISESTTIVVVKLSSSGDSINVRKPIVHINFK